MKSSRLIKPILFAFHGYESLIRDIFFDRHNHNLLIHGYREEGDITTPFDMQVFSELDDILERHREFIRQSGEDLIDVTD